ncbi:MAG: hypothetical protein IT374_12625, partial [Polyangiaceae bacterium]|nr:hypothetical protein [Polyangiaceae bacterium]
ASVVLRRGAAYSLDDLVVSRAALAATLISAAGLGAYLALRGRAAPPWRAGVWLIALGVALSTTAFGAFAAYADRARAQVALPIAAAALGVCFGGASASVARVAVGLTPLRVGVPRALSAGPVALALVGLLALVALIERGGPLRASAGLGVVSIALGGVAADLLAGAAPGARRVAGASLIATVLVAPSLALAEAFTPLAEAVAWPEPPVSAATGASSRLVVTSGRGAYQAYVDGALRFSSLDAHRRREALAHPAMLAARRRAHVLVLSGGDGGAAREVLRWPGVARVVVVEPDEVVLAAGHEHPVFLAHNAGALRDPRVLAVRSDVFAYLARGDERFDVILLDAPEPDTPARSKLTTRAGFKRIAQRLAEGGVGAVALPSPLSQRRAFSSALASIAGAGLHALPYRAEIPTFGLRGHALFARAPLDAPQGELPPGLSWLDAAVLRAAFALSPDERPDLAAPPSLLHAQVLPEVGRAP